MKFPLSSFLFTVVLFPSTEVKGAACTWTEDNYLHDGPYVDGGIRYTVAEAKDKCVELGTSVCGVITCNDVPLGCTMRSSSLDIKTHSGFVSYVPSGDCDVETSEVGTNEVLAVGEGGLDSRLLFPSTEVMAGDVEISTNEILAVGEGGLDSPHGTVGITMDQLTIVTFFEAHPLQFSKGIDQAITIEVYANVDDDEDDCTKGTLLEDMGSDFVMTTESKQYNDYSTTFGGTTGLDYPVTSNGVVGSASVAFSNFQYVPTDVNKKIWFLGDGDKDGEIRLCIVTSIKIDYDNDGEQDYVVSHMDSKRIISIDLLADIEDQVIDITESKATDSESDAVLYVEVATFLCNNKHKPVPADKKYKSGQDFRICVGPTDEGVEKGYKVDQFIELICGGRTLVIPDVGGGGDIGTDVLTTADGVYLNNNLAIQSVLTAQDARDVGTSSITCTGKVSLSYSDGGSGADGTGDTDTNTGGSYSSGPECTALCSGEGNRGPSKVPADYGFSDFRPWPIIQSYLDGESGDESARAKYGNIINCWDTSLVTSFRMAFGYKKTWNEPVHCWDTSSAIEMKEIFYACEAFNQDVNTWDTSRVTDMGSVFSMNYKFNQDISNWDTAKVTDMSFMLGNNYIFNQDINTWDTSSVTTMRMMFYKATAFNQNLCNWDISRVTSFSNMLTQSKCGVKSNPTDDAVCQTCDNGRLLVGSSNNSNNNNKRSNTRRTLPGIVGDDDTSVVAAPFHMSATVNNADGPVRAVLRDLQPLTTGLDLSGGGEEAEELLEGLFEVDIEMESPRNESSSSAPCFSSLMTTTVAVLAVGSLLSVVVSSMI